MYIDVNFKTDPAMQILPAKELLPFIRHYLFLESKGNDLKKLRLFSDGNMGIVFSFKSNLLNDSDEAGQLEFLPGSFLYGQISEFKDVCLRYETDLIIVVFQPTGINQLMGISADELRDKIIRTEYIFNKQGQELYEKLAEKIAIQNKLRLLNIFFLEQMAKRVMPDDSLIKATLNFIVKNKGLISSNQLIKLTGYTERHIERKFIESVGINPKKFSNIVKLHVFLKQLKCNQNNKNLTHMAYEAGYADQSHLIKEFKKITGMTPKIYQGNADKLTINFVKLNNKGVQF
jgi:AraC-like DNA-binding protein